jgi:hypothetical protein
MRRLTESEIEEAAQRFGRLADALDPTAAQVESINNFGALTDCRRRRSPIEHAHPHRPQDA